MQQRGSRFPTPRCVAHAETHPLPLDAEASSPAGNYRRQTPCRPLKSLFPQQVVYAYNHRDPKAQRRALAYTEALSDKVHPVHLCTRHGSHTTPVPATLLETAVMCIVEEATLRLLTACLNRHRPILLQGVDFVLLAADPRPLHPRFFSDRIEDVAPEVSQQLFDALRGGGFLDAHGYLIENPRWSA